MAWLWWSGKWRFPQDVGGAEGFWCGTDLSFTIYLDPALNKEYSCASGFPVEPKGRVEHAATRDVVGGEPLRYGDTKTSIRLSLLPRFSHLNSNKVMAVEEVYER